MDAEEAKQVVEAAIAKGLAKKPAVQAESLEVQPESPQPQTQVEKYIEKLKAEDAKPKEPMAVIVKSSSPHGPMELEVSATTPLEMAQAQDGLIAWCHRKVASMKHEAAELAENLAIAIKNKWKTNTLRRHAALAEKRVTFYEKIKAALEAGYCIVPNFPITLFAIRTDKSKPAEMYSVNNYYSLQSSTGFVKIQEAKMLPVGEGEYQNPQAPAKMTYLGEVKENNNTKQQYASCATEWGEIEFPIQMAKPSIMKTTSLAMKLKVFDQLGILLPQAAKADPLIVGEILDPRPIGYGTRKRICFIIAWHLNVRDL